MAKAKTGPKTKKKLGGPRPAGGGPRAEKAAVVASIKERLGGGPALLTEYRGLTVAELAELRRALAGNADYKVVKNRLATIAAREVGLEDLLPLFDGPTAVAFVTGDLAKVAKDIAEFAKRVPALSLKGGVFEGRVLSAAEARSLATLESREVMLARIAGLLVAPIQQTANVFAAGLRQLGSLFAQLKDARAAEPAG